jgi:CRISPR-associated protein Cmr2
MSPPVNQYFHFTIGPVQGFVAQARRTRDFWAGSFLLSWLATVAMREVEHQGGTLRFPLPDPGFLAALQGRGGDKPPLQGNVPNRFIAEVPESFSPTAVSAAVQDAWCGLADQVWRHDLQSRADDATHAIWTRQVGSFWEISWARTHDLDDSSALDRRKNWRAHLPPPEPGVKCMVMDGLQELSAAASPTGTGGQDLAAFWQGLRDAPLTGIASDLADGEYLCAIAFIKRRFPRHFGALRVDLDSGWTAHGWPVPTAIPSVAYLAAAPWLAGLLMQEDKSGLESFHRQALALCGGDQPEWDSNVRCVRDADAPRRWKALDGSVFFDHKLDNPRLWARPEHAAEVKNQLATLRRKAGSEAVSPFYAVLLMDGDSLGKQMSQPERQTPITEALARFTDGVAALVDQHSGFLVYSGGDDVLALLPLEHALPCAAALRHHYLDSFAAGGVPSSLSGAIQFAHINMPLTRVLGDAHSLLDDIAKDHTGRDAIACRVWKPGGRGLYR